MTSGSKAFSSLDGIGSCQAFTTATFTCHTTRSTAHSFLITGLLSPYAIPLDSALRVPAGLIVAQYRTDICSSLPGLRPDHTKMSTEAPAATDPFLELVNAIKAALTPTPTPPPASGSPMAVPAKFAGEATECSGFLLQVNLYIQMQPQQFPSDKSKVAFLTSLLTGKALQWAKAIWNANNPIINSYDLFTNHFSEVFSTATGTLSTSDQLFRLRQGSTEVNEYTLHFRTLAAASGWNEIALLGAYRQGLNPEIRAAMAIYDDSIGLESFLQRTTRVAQQLAACQPTVTAPQSASVVASSPVPEPMQVDSTRLSRSERNRRISQGLCLYCGQPGHLLRNCPIRPPRPVVSTILSDIETAKLTLLSATLHTSNRSLPVSALIDSGSSGNFISTKCLKELHLARHRHHQIYSVTTIQGKPLGRGVVRYSSPFITLQIGLFHHEDLRFQVLEDSTVDIILGRPWLQVHQPEIRWDPCDIIRWSQKCSTSHPHHRPRRASSSQLNSQIIQQPYPLPLVPAALKELRGSQVFTKLDLRSAYNLIRIREGDEWKTAFITPTGHYEYQVMPYGLSVSPSVFQTFMNEVFREFLHRFVVVYIDDIPDLLPEHGRTLPARPAGYNINSEGVLMDQGKVDAIQNWPQPDSIKALQRFLGFANFYRRFIKDYSSIIAPLTSLLRGKPRRLTWDPAAHEAFQHIKKLFSTAPLLHHPDPNLPFTVEADASTTGVGAVLSQAVGESSILHPCAFFSRKLSPAEQNYDVGNGELLAIKLALEEWRHWLEGAVHPFTIITDHKNLQYLRDAKRLNPSQARWALFFTRFRFTITYRPGSKNIPADALSRQTSADLHTDSEPIIPPPLIVSPIIWSLDQDIHQATLQEPAPPECPEGKIYVPRSLRPHLLGTAHGSPGSGHPGSKRTLSLLQNRYWWPSMRRDTIRYVQSCSVCAMSNSPCMLPAGKLVPLPIPERPWSHLGVDFVSDLPSSEGNTCILVIVDRFSKTCKFVPLKGLPTAMETAEHLFNQVFRHFGIPEEIVSDRGPQFISHVWKAFFKLLGVTVNLSSGYHPQTNGQTERKIQELGRYLRAYCHEDQHSWSRFLPWAEHAQNSLCQDSTGITPFQCVLGYQPPLFPWTEEPSNVPAVDHWFRESERVWDSAHHHLQRATQNFTYLPTRRSGLAVDLRLRLPCRKLSPRYIGPFKILRQINEVTFQLQLPPRYRIHPTFHVSLLKPFFPSATEPPGAELEPPPPEVLDQTSIYAVREILDSRRRGGHLEYLIDWEGYGPEERSWVPRDDVLDPMLLADFHRDHSDRPAPRGRGRPRRRVRASGAAPGGGGSVRHSPQPPSPATPPGAPPTRSSSPEF
ncbi:Transposon Tf2-8 polyprotein [Labeo rohita]|uniref:Gypsy retrotransposon integrase-like protein 1 n=1 Tax=Labeo rohita TaxID=84645 RepID=A0ABQ8L628_LABRO|nr:Transposon Tf2-8 polyprotein [Labeo rohita]